MPKMVKKKNRGQSIIVRHNINSLKLFFFIKMLNYLVGQYGQGMMEIHGLLKSKHGYFNKRVTVSSQSGRNTIGFIPHN